MSEVRERAPLGELLTRRDERLGSAAEPRILTVTEGNGLVDQLEHWGRRVATADVSSYKVVHPGDVVYNVYLLWNGAIGQNRFEEPGVTSPVYEVFSPTDKVVPRYLGLLMQSPSMLDAFDSISIGTIPRRRRAPWQDFLQLPVHAPDLQEQDRVVDLMDAIDNAVDVARRSAEGISYARARLFEAETASAGELVAIDKLAEVSQGRSLPKRVQGDQSGPTPWFKIADMAKAPNVHGYRAAETRLSADSIRALGGRVVPAGAVVFPRVGAAVATEKKRIMDVAGALDENHLVLTPRADTPSEVLLAALEHLRLGSMVQPGAVPSLNMAMIRQTLVRWPEGHNKVSELAGIMSATRLAARGAAEHLRRLSALRATTLDALLSGAHQIPDSYDDMMAV